MIGVSLQQIPSAPDRMLITAAFQIAPNQLFSYFVEPALIKRWWASEAVVEARQGGYYHLQWPAMNWHLRGEFTSFLPGNELAFTWRWDHEPQVRTRTVVISFTSYHDGSKLSLEHGPYGSEAEEQSDRQSHSEGWLHFLGILQSVTRS